MTAMIRPATTSRARLRRRKNGRMALKEVNSALLVTVESQAKQLTELERRVERADEDERQRSEVSAVGDDDDRLRR